ncbi:MAG: hypothetical protein JW725_03425 [Candidatus Babeliaceae bacterium]|nr:hypothetical protein [Candidatus Babeliaceae bacterium]
MDHEILVSTFHEVVQALRQRTGHIALFLLNALDTENTSWHILISTDTYDQMTIKTALRDFMTILERHVETNVLKSILRVTILKTSDSFVKAVNRTFDVTEEVEYLYTCTLANVYIERGILFESQAPLSVSTVAGAKKSRRRKKESPVVPVP